MFCSVGFECEDCSILATACSILTSSTTSPPPALSEDIVVDKKRKHAKVFASSSAYTSKTVAGESSVPEDGGELFDFMDS
jgi:hypothetical protein